MCEYNILQRQGARKVCLSVCLYFSLILSNLKTQAASFSETLVSTNKNINVSVITQKPNAQLQTTKQSYFLQMNFVQGWARISFKSMKKHSL
jgi:hypothetical protein